MQPTEYELLAIDRDDPKIWGGRGFSNPHKHLVADPGPLPYRIPRIRAEPSLAKYLLRLIVLRESAEIIGSAGFHAGPDEAGMMEIGIRIEQAFQCQGYAQETLRGMWDWVIQDSSVLTLRYTVSPTNQPSVAIIRKLGFELLGQQMDEVDGIEDIYEMSRDEYTWKFGLIPRIQQP